MQVWKHGSGTAARGRAVPCVVPWGLKGSSAEELGGLKGGTRAGTPLLWGLFNTGGDGMESVSKRTAVSGITARTGFLCPQVCTVRATLHKPTRESSGGTQLWASAELPSEEREGEASGVCASLQIRLEVISLFLYN